MHSEDDIQNADIQYALETTEVLYEPDRRIDTFGTTRFQFHLISELMDDVQQVRVRSGEIQADRPLILKPDPDFEFEGFGEQAPSFSRWMRQQMGGAALLKYGFSFRKSGVTETVVHDSVAVVTDRVIAQARESNNPMEAVILGVDDTWEISLLKFTVEMIQKSHKINIFDFKRRGLL